MNRAEQILIIIIDVMRTLGLGYGNAMNVPLGPDCTSYIQSPRHSMDSFSSIKSHGMDEASIRHASKHGQTGKSQERRKKNKILTKTLDVSIHETMVMPVLLANPSTASPLSRQNTLGSSIPQLGA